jgi:outer membrane lipoprotein-sorting protein
MKLKLGMLMIVLTSACRPATAQTVDDIVAKHVAARGLDKLKAVQTLVLTGRLVGPGMEAPVTIQLKRPYKYRLDMKLGGNQITDATDGKVAWHAEPTASGSGIQQVTGDAMTGITDQSEFDSPFVDYKAKGYTIELAGEEQVNGNACYKVRITLRTGTIMFQYLDKNSFLEVKEELIRTVDGNKLEVEETVSDYKKVGGVLFPHFYDSWTKGTPEHYRLTIEKIELDVPLDDSIFNMAEKKIASLSSDSEAEDEEQSPVTTIVTPVISTAAGGAAVEQRSQGERPAAEIVASFDGLGFGFEGPQGTANLRNPSDNSLAVGKDHIFQIVNTRMAVFSKKGKRFKETGKPLYGPVATNTVFKGFGGACESMNNGDAVVRYDQLADRWVIVMPTFRRQAVRDDQPVAGKSGDPAQLSVPGRPGQPGAAAPLFVPERELAQPPQPRPAEAAPGQPARPAPRPNPQPTGPQGPYSMCYAISTTGDPLGSYYRYEFLRALFPDYPRPAVWPDGYYIPTSTGDDVIQKHACVAEREKMLKGEPAKEQCVIIDGVNFLNNSDLDGKQLPPAGAPNIMIAAGGTQLKKVLEDNVVLAWQFHVDWNDPSKTKLIGPRKIEVAPYHYLCDGQLTNCVPQPGIDRRLDSQGDKIMARLVYRRIGDQESIVGVHSINTSVGGGAVRWYEFRVGKDRELALHQQGTYAPDRFYRWMGSPAMDGKGNIGIGYSFGGSPNYVGQRFAGRLAKDPSGQLTLKETVLVEGQDAQNAMRWEDYTQTAVDPSDDCTIWYVGDYLKKGATNYTTRIGGFRMPGCK